MLADAGTRIDEGGLKSRSAWPSSSSERSSSALAEGHAAFLAGDVSADGKVSHNRRVAGGGFRGSTTHGGSFRSQRSWMARSKRGRCEDLQPAAGKKVIAEMTPTPV